MADNTTAGHVAEPAPNEVAPDSAPADQPQASAATSYAIADLHGRHAYRLLTSLVAPRPIAWISTLAADGTPNLAPFSFFNIVSGRPLMVMFSSGRRKDGEPKDTLANAAATGEFVVNLADETLAAQVNLTSATVGPNVNEFEAFGVKPAPSTDVKPPGGQRQSRAGGARGASHPHRRLHLHPRARARAQGSREPAVLGPDGLADATKLAPIARLGRDEYAALGRVFSLTRPD